VVSDKLQEPLIKSSTRSGGMNLARRFNAGSGSIACPRRRATIESLKVQASLRDAAYLVGSSFPALKEPVSKLGRTQRESTPYAEGV